MSGGYHRNRTLVFPSISTLRANIYKKKKKKNYSNKIIWIELFELKNNLVEESPNTVYFYPTYLTS